MFPSPVITELDGLAKGQDNFIGGMGSGGRSTGTRGNCNVSSAHARAVQEKARLAVAFLERGFEAREPCLRALTSRGNQLESIAFRSEDTSGQQARARLNVSFMFWLFLACVINAFLFFLRVIMMMSFCLAVSTTVRTRQKISCRIREVCNGLFFVLPATQTLSITCLLLFSLVAPHTQTGQWGSKEKWCFLQMTATCVSKPWPATSQFETFLLSSAGPKWAEPG